jgi:hypothetical protein
MMKQALYGILSLLVLALACIVIYIGALTILVAPGETRQAGAFTIERGVYLDAPEGRVYPAVVESADAITYTFVVRK